MSSNVPTPAYRTNMSIKSQTKSLPLSYSKHEEYKYINETSPKPLFVILFPPERTNGKAYIHAYIHTETDASRCALIANKLVLQAINNEMNSV